MNIDYLESLRSRLAAESASYHADATVARKSSDVQWLPAELEYAARIIGGIAHSLEEHMRDMKGVAP